MQIGEPYLKGKANSPFEGGEYRGNGLGDFHF